MSETIPDTATESAEPSAPADEIIAEPDVGYRWKHLIMSVLLIAAGAWFAYDGWHKWPAENREIDRVQKAREAARASGNTVEDEKLAKELQTLSPHTPMDIAIQKVLAAILPAFGIFWGAWTLRDTRGQYRLAVDTLHAPGHPPVSFNDIRRIDKRKWDKKGIAFLHYEVGQPPVAGVVKLDDFAYERKPVDEILERIERNVLSSVPTDVAARKTTA
jgi:hypothetical protein